jgi:hypothetical protein
VPEGERPKQLTERTLCGVVEVVLTSEDNYLMIQNRMPDRTHRPGIEVAAESEADDFSTDVRGELA